MRAEWHSMYNIGYGQNSRVAFILPTFDRFHSIQQENSSLSSSMSVVMVVVQRYLVDLLIFLMKFGACVLLTRELLMKLHFNCCNCRTPVKKIFGFYNVIEVIENDTPTNSHTLNLSTK